jgi:hypothetical protein
MSEELENVEETNAENPMDVNGDGVVDAKDVAEVANAAAAEEEAKEEAVEETTEAPAPEEPATEELVAETPAEENTVSPAEAPSAEKMIKVKEGLEIKQSVVFNRRRG